LFGGRYLLYIEMSDNGSREGLGKSRSLVSTSGSWLLDICMVVLGGCLLPKQGEVCLCSGYRFEV
jgi:hypothetical protein